MSWGKVRACHGWERRGAWEGAQHLYMSQMLPPRRRPAQTSPGKPMGFAEGGTSSEPTLLSCPPSPEPQITSPPYDTWNITGQDVIFGCEVFAYPMASIEWRKDGTEMLLPGDDPHISVQVSGVSLGCWT